MPRDARGAHNTTAENDFGIAEYSDEEHYCEAIDGDEHGSFERNGAFEKRRQPKSQLKRKNRKGRAEADRHEQRDLFAESSLTVPMARREPRRGHEIGHERGDEQIHE